MTTAVVRKKPRPNEDVRDHLRLRWQTESHQESKVERMKSSCGLHRSHHRLDQLQQLAMSGAWWEACSKLTRKTSACQAALRNKAIPRPSVPDAGSGQASLCRPAAQRDKDEKNKSLGDVCFTPKSGHGACSARCVSGRTSTRKPRTQLSPRQKRLLELISLDGG